MFFAGDGYKNLRSATLDPASISCQAKENKLEMDIERNNSGASAKNLHLNFDILKWCHWYQVSGANGICTARVQGVCASR
jgi:hypothetical protein